MTNIRSVTRSGVPIPLLVIDVNFRAYGLNHIPVVVPEFLFNHNHYSELLEHL